MTAYRNYWLLSALLLVITIYASQLGVFVWFLENFSEPKTLVASIIIIGVFLYAYVVIGHRAGLQLQNEDKALSEIENMFDSSSDDEIVSTVESLLDIDYDHNLAWWQKSIIGHIFIEPFLISDNAHKQAWWQNSATGRAISDLAYRVQTMKKVSTKEPINRSMFQEDFETDLSHSTDLLERYRMILFYIGVLGTVVGIVLALTAQTVPENAEEAKTFTFNVIQGMGLAYTTSMLGMGSALILYILNGVYENNMNAISQRFRENMFRSIFPVIHSKAFGYKGGHCDDATKKE